MNVDSTDGEAGRWGSDAVVELLRSLDVRYVSLVPGSSFRGLHDSIVNLGGQQNPKMVLCLHEEHAVAIAHGYAKVAERPMLSVLHSNVGLMHATMAVWNAFTDRAPILILGGTGPLDAARRRPWIDWIHTPLDLGALVRPFTKWDDQPTSLHASLEAIMRAWTIAYTPPYGPVYVALDSAVQEQRLNDAVRIPDVARHGPPLESEALAVDVARAADVIRTAKHPVILAGRVSRSLAAWQQRVALAEQLGAKVITDLRVGAAFPTDHPLHAGAPGLFLHDVSKAALREADVLINLDFVDPAGTLQQAFGDVPPPLTIVSASLDRFVHNAWSRDHHLLGPVDLDFAVHPDRFVAQLSAALGVVGTAPAALNGHRNGAAHPPTPADPAAPIMLPDLGNAVIAALAGRDVCFARVPIGGLGDIVFRHPLDCLGKDGGGGVGSGPGMAVGAALALRDLDPNRVPVAILGDGDFLMGSNALWTAVNSKIPLLIIVSNNRSFFNDELHQERMARERGRPVENRWIGQRIDSPPPDIAGLARSYGGVGIGPVETVGDLYAAVRQGIAEVAAGKLCVIDSLVAVGYKGTIGGYSQSVAAAITGSRAQ